MIFIVYGYDAVWFIFADKKPIGKLPAFRNQR